VPKSLIRISVERSAEYSHRLQRSHFTNCQPSYNNCFFPKTDCMEQRPSSEANSSSARQEIRCSLWNPKLHDRVHISPTPVHIL